MDDITGGTLRRCIGGADVGAPSENELKSRAVTSMWQIATKLAR
jgi:hypothetical protein